MVFRLRLCTAKVLTISKSWIFSMLQKRLLHLGGGLIFQLQNFVLVNERANTPRIRYRGFSECSLSPISIPAIQAWHFWVKFTSCRWNFGSGRVVDIHRRVSGWWSQPQFGYRVPEQAYHAGVALISNTGSTESPRFSPYTISAGLTVNSSRWAPKAEKDERQGPRPHRIVVSNEGGFRCPVLTFQHPIGPQ